MLKIEFRSNRIFWYDGHRKGELTVVTITPHIKTDPFETAENCGCINSGNAKEAEAGLLPSLGLPT